MTQYDFGTLSPGSDGGTTLAAKLNGVIPALLTQHKGPERPGYTQPGMLWINDAGATWLLALYDGEQDITLAGIDPATHALTTAGVPPSRKIRTGTALLLNGASGTDDAPAEADLTADLRIEIDLAAKALAQSVWDAGVSDVVAPISPEQLAAKIASQAGGGGWDLVVEDRKGVGAGGGACVSGWQTRALSTVVTNSLGAVVSSNAVTLPAGSYEVEYDAPAYTPNAHRVRLYDVTHGVVLGYGTSENADGNNFVDSRSWGYARLVLSSPTMIRIDHYTLTARGDTNALGFASGVVTEIYTRVFVRRIA